MFGPQVMIGSLPYQDTDHFPKAMALDFSRLNKLSLDELIKRPQQPKVDHYFCDEVLKPLVDKLNAQL